VTAPGRTTTRTVAGGLTRTCPGRSTGLPGRHRGTDRRQWPVRNRCDITVRGSAGPARTGSRVATVGAPKERSVTAATHRPSQKVIKSVVESTYPHGGVVGITSTAAGVERVSSRVRIGSAESPQCNTESDRSPGECGRARSSMRCYQNVTGEISATCGDDHKGVSPVFVGTGQVCD